MVEKHGDLSLTRQCGLLGINRTTLYYKPAPPDPMVLLIKQVIDYIYTNRPVFGHRRITKELIEVYELLIDRKTTLRYMSEMGIQAIYGYAQ